MRWVIGGARKSLPSPTRDRTLALFLKNPISWRRQGHFEGKFHHESELLRMPNKRVHSMIEYRRLRINEFHRLKPRFGLAFVCVLNADPSLQTPTIPAHQSSFSTKKDFLPVPYSPFTTSDTPDAVCFHNPPKAFDQSSSNHSYAWDFSPAKPIWKFNMASLYASSALFGIQLELSYF